jgi:UDP-N-acetylmuramoyl-L-alanyl-D-glutamate--2,6-diaminopimelate ligase
VKLSKLFPKHGLDVDPEVRDLVYDSRFVKPDVVFFAIPGFSVDGTTFVADAFDSGAIAAVVENIERVPKELRSKCIKVKSVRSALALASKEFFDNPSEDLLLIGVTGTKGKTSTTFLIDSILKSAGLRPALLGTVLCRHPGGEKPAKRTTAESYELQKFLRAAVNARAKSAVVEVSSHALVLDRVLGCEFDAAVFTNLTEDHLDFHKTMDAYYEAKKILFTKYDVSTAAVSIDDDYGKKLKQETENAVSYGLNKNADFCFSQVTLSENGIQGKISGPKGFEIDIQSPLVGEFNQKNILGAVAVAAALEIPAEAIAEGIAKLSGVSGRVERVPTNLPFQVFVDFAHMGTALENVLQSLRTVCTGRLIVVFGAGGDRDPARRGQLGKVAARLADYSVVTSDNPRSESPEKIIAAIESAYLKELGGKPKNYKIEEDRRKAIRIALEMAKAGDVICLAGKGHETGQEINGVVHAFDDRIEAAKILREIEVDTPLKN